MTLDELLYEAFDLLAKREAAQWDAAMAEAEEMEYSDQFKKCMNRMFRERIGIKKIPHPEVDNLYERMRSGFIRFWRVAFRPLRRKNSGSRKYK